MKITPSLQVLTEADWEHARDIRLRALRDCPDPFGALLEHEMDLSAEHGRRRLRRSDASTVIATVDAARDVRLIVGLYTDGTQRFAL